MSKRHFEALAKRFKASKPYVPQDGDGLTAQELRDRHVKAAQWNIAVVDVADVCAASNAAFNRQRFYAACGLEVK